MSTFGYSVLLATALLAQPVQASDDAHIAAAVQHSARSEADRARDARDRPLELLSFAGLRPGMKTADIMASGGYFTELLSRAVGPDGKVLLLNNVPYDFPAREELKKRLGEQRLPNVERRVVEFGHMQLEPRSLDFVMIFMGYHDLYFSSPQQGWPTLDAGRFLDQIRQALKPGGLLLLVDNAARASGDASAAQNLHRIDEEFARRDLARHGLKFVRSWEGLRSPGDSRELSVFDPAIKGKTDRFVHLYRR
jgi:predicted methyltransferase